MFIRPRQDANDSLSVLRPWCNAIRVRTPPVLVVSDTIGVNKLTARGIVVRYAREGRIAERPRGGQNNVRVDEEMKESLSDIVNENCLLTLSQINQELRQRLRNKHEIHDRRSRGPCKVCCIEWNKRELYQLREIDQMWSINDTTTLVGLWGMPWWTTVFSSMNAATIYSLLETKEEPEPERGRTAKFAGKEGEMLPWHLPFL